MKYFEIYKGWKDNPIEFWKKNAEDVSWIKFPEKILKKKSDYFYEWFSDGVLNTCYNALDKNIFNLSDKEIEHEKNRALDDASQIFRLNQLENEGNDPIESGESYGTPHDLANLYSTKRDKAIKDIPDGYDEEKPGRPPIKLSRYGTDQANMGRDPLGKAGLTADDSPNRTNDVSAFALEENSRLLKKLSLTRLKGKQLLKEDNKPSIMDEENIIDE